MSATSEAPRPGSPRQDSSAGADGKLLAYRGLRPLIRRRLLSVRQAPLSVPSSVVDDGR